MRKNFTSISRQIDILQNEKGIIVDNIAYAEDILRRIGYYPLMGGYKHLFRIPLTKNYKEGTKFEEIVALYEFDAGLRELFFKYLLQIERHLRSLVSYYFSEKYGESQSAYLDLANYNNTRRTHTTATRLIATLQYATTASNHDYIEYYRKTHGNIPLWVLVNVLTFGNLSKMYQVFDQSIQSKICKSIGDVNQRQLKQFLSILTKFRNVCAHGERLFTFKTIDTIADLPIHRTLNIHLSNFYSYIASAGK